MERATIGAVLRKRIKEMGFTQKEFAEHVGIGESTLKKYMNGTYAYDYELLDRFATALECSYDYLLGRSKSANREYHDISEQTRLSDRALDRLHDYAERYDKDYYSKAYIKTLDIMINTNGIVTSIFNYLMFSHYMEETEEAYTKLLYEKMNEQWDITESMIKDASTLNLENKYLISVVSSIKDAKKLVTTELLEELKKLQPLEVTKQRVNELLAPEVQ